MYTTEKIMNFGASNFIIARLMMQSMTLMSFIKLNKKKEDAINLLLFEKLVPRLIGAFEIAEWLDNEISKGLAEFESKLKEGEKGFSVQKPFVIGLQQNSENFFYQLKLYLRDLVEIFTLLEFGEFKGSNYSKIITVCCNPDASGLTYRIVLQLFSNAVNDQLSLFLPENLRGKKREWLTHTLKS